MNVPCKFNEPLLHPVEMGLIKDIDNMSMIEIVLVVDMAIMQMVVDNDEALFTCENAIMKMVSDND